jgi:hypothetical protein
MEYRLMKLSKALIFLVLPVVGVAIAFFAMFIFIILAAVMATVTVTFFTWWALGKPITIKQKDVKIGELRWFTFTKKG